MRFLMQMLRMNSIFLTLLLTSRADMTKHAPITHFYTSSQSLLDGTFYRIANFFILEKSACKHHPQRRAVIVTTSREPTSRITYLLRNVGGVHILS
jgi:hypothetical protein